MHSAIVVSKGIKLCRFIDEASAQPGYDLPWPEYTWPEYKMSIRNLGNIKKGNAHASV
jgi:hypothetical protein